MALPVVSNNTPVAGSISWTAFGISFGTNNYSVAAGNTSKKYVWWEYRNGTPAIVSSDSFPTLADEDVLLFLNKNGIGATVPLTDVMDGSLIVPQSIYANAIAAEQIDSTHIKAGSIQTDALGAGVITTDKLAVGSVGDNLCTNGSFEEFANGMPVGWRTTITPVNGSVDVVSGVASSGKFCARLTATSTTADIRLDQDLTKVIPVSSADNRAWYVSARVGAGTAITKGVYLRVRWLTEAKGFISNTDVQSNIAMGTSFTLIEGQATPPSTARYMSVSVMLLNPNVVTNLYVDEITAREVVMSALIGDGQITTKKVSASAITATEIAANAVNAKHLFVGDLANLAFDGKFEDTTAKNWGGPGTVVSVANGLNWMRVDATAVGSVDIPNLNQFQVTQGEWIYAEVEVFGAVANTGTGTVNMHLATTRLDGTKQWPIFDIKTRSEVSGAWTKLSGQIQVPANGKLAQIQLNVGAAGTGITGNYYYFRNVIARRMNGGELIVDGAVTAKQIKGGTITSAEIAANTIGVDKLVVASGTNLAYNGSAELANSDVGYSGFTRQTTDVPPGFSAAWSSTAGQSTTNFLNAPAVPIKPNTTYGVTVWIKSDIPGTKTYLEPMTGSTATGMRTNPIYAFSNIDVPTTWGGTTGKPLTTVFTTGNAPLNTLYFRWFINHANGAQGSVFSFTGFTLYEMNAGELLVDGGIVSRHIATGSIASKKIAVTDMTNFAPSYRESPEDWEIDSPIAVVPSSITDNIDKQRFQLIDNTGTAKLARGPWIAATPGQEFYAEGKIYRTGSTANAINLRYYFYNKDRTYLSSASLTLDGATTPQNSPSGFLQKIKAVAPADTAYARLAVVMTNSTSADVSMYNVNGYRRNSGELIVDGAITSKKLESDLVLSTKIIAGNPTGTRAEMTSGGFRAYAADGSGGSSEVVRLGTDTDDYFAIVKQDGTLAASINQSGGIGAPSANISESLVYKGRELTDHFAKSPRGIVNWAQFTGSQLPTVNNGSEIGLFELAWVPDSTRMYAVHCTPITFTPSAAMSLTMNLRYTTNGSVPTVNSAILARDIKVVHTGTLSITVGMHDRLIGGFNGSHIRVLFTISAAAGGNAVPLSAQEPTAWVEDIGPAFPQGGVITTGGGANVNPVATYEKYYTAVDRRNYQGNNTLYTYGNHSTMYQGTSPAGVGKLKSMAFFNDMTADLSGATINDIQVYFYFNHWYNNAGGTAAIGVHGNTGTPPSTFAWGGGGQVINVPGWQKPGGQWVSIPSAYWNGFKTGAYRGLVLGGGTYDNGTYEYYGIAAPNPQIYVRYTK